jgi:hypothetical protein
MLADFNNSFTVPIGNDLRTHLLLNLPLHLNWVAALPCKIRAGTISQETRTTKYVLPKFDSSENATAAAYFKFWLLPLLTYSFIT